MMNNHNERLQKILEAGVINKDTKLEDVLKLSEQLAKLSPPGEEGWTFISEHYIYTDDKPVNPGDFGGGLPDGGGLPGN